MTAEEHATRLGKLLSSFQSLEFLIRLFLQGTRPLGIPYGIEIYSYPVGADLPLNELTNRDSLGKLFARYNAEMARRRHPQIDGTLVEIRDALAHGRVSAAAPSDNLRVLKFSKPKNNRVRVMFNEQLSSDWFNAQNQRVVDAIKQVRSELSP